MQNKMPCDGWDDVGGGEKSIFTVLLTTKIHDPIHSQHQNIEKKRKIS